MRQSFMPMWDTETAAIQMANIARLAAGGNLVRAFSGPNDGDVRVLYDALQQHKHLKEETDMKGYSVEFGYMGLVDGRYMLFASEGEYRSYLEDRNAMSR